MLALIHHHRSGRAALAEALLAYACPLAAAATLDSAVDLEARRSARRSAYILDRLGITLIPVWELPPVLLRVRPLPPALFVRGDSRLLARPGLAIVGARDACPTAQRWAMALARGAAARGELIVSGGARGIDAAAHRGALAGRAPTVAYLGVAADRIYPSVNRRLFVELLARGGALVSEYPPGEATFGSAHAMRNRLIAAQAHTLVIAEADTGSGSLGTAVFAKRLGVPIRVSPAGVGRKRLGMDTLLRAGEARVWHEIETEGG